MPLGKRRSISTNPDAAHPARTVRKEVLQPLSALCPIRTGSLVTSIPRAQAGFQTPFVAWVTSALLLFLAGSLGLPGLGIMAGGLPARPYSLAVELGLAFGLFIRSVLMGFEMASSPIRLANSDSAGCAASAASSRSTSVSSRSISVALSSASASTCALSSAFQTARGMPAGWGSAFCFGRFRRGFRLASLWHRRYLLCKIELHVGRGRRRKQEDALRLQPVPADRSGVTDAERLRPSLLPLPIF